MLQSDKIYECQTCGKTFNRRTYLQLHEKIHGEKCYKCNICDKSFRQPAGLWIHKKHQSCLKRNLPSDRQTSSCNATEQFDEETDYNGKRHKCDICSRRFSQKHVLTYHKRTHTGENPYPCTICGKMFRGPGTLKYHERTHTGQKPYSCIFCLKAFAQLGSLRLHCRNEHQTEKIYECDVCKQQFVKFREVSSHKKTHSDISKQGESPRETPFNEVARDSRETHEELQSTRYETRSNLMDKVDEEGKEHICIKEDNSSSGRSVYAKKRKRKDLQGSNKLKGTAHRTRSKTPTKDCMITSHARDESFISVDGGISASMVCKGMKTIADIDASLLDDQVLARPVKEMHEDPCLDGKKHKCDVCSQQFSQAHVLKYHKRIHTGENPHACTVCNKTFRTPGALTVHLRTHNGQKPYKCIFCRQGFTQRGALLQHCRRIHFSDQIYECGVCKEKFEKYRDLSSHSHIHSNVSCTLVKRIDDKAMEEDESKPLKQVESTRLDLLPPMNVSMADCDSEKESKSLLSAERSCNVPDGAHEKHTTKRSNNTYEHAENKDISSMHHINHEKVDCNTYAENNSQVFNLCQDGDDKQFTNSPYRAYKEMGNMDVSFLDECLPGSIQQDREECGRSNDSGISPDTSPLDVVVECDERESDLIYEVSMQPIKMVCEGKDYLSNIVNRSSQTIGSIAISPQENENLSTVVVDEHSKTISDDDEISSCFRVATPDVDHIFSCDGDLQQNSFFERESETSISCQLLRGNHNQTYEEGNPITTSNYPLMKNGNPSSSMHVQPNCTDLDLVQAFSDYSKNIPVHFDGSNSDYKKLYMEYDRNVCESQTSNVWERREDQQIFTKRILSLASRILLQESPIMTTKCILYQVRAK